MSRLPSLLLLASALPLLAAESPTLIPFQAQLTNQDNVLYQTGTYTITFNLYDQAVGGASLWTERHQQVGVISGAVNVFLGSIEDLPANEFTQTLYLGITIDADNNANTPDPEMVPRQMIIPAFHSKNAEKLAGHDWTTVLVGNSNDPSAAKIRGSAIQAAGITAVQIRDGEVKADEIATGAVGTDEILDGSVQLNDLSEDLYRNIVPVGTIVAFWGQTNPPGWLQCHGQPVPTGSEFQKLRNLVGSNVPDLRGLFLRGINQGRSDAYRDEGVASGANRAIGDLQQDSFEDHSHGIHFKAVALTGGNKVAVDPAQITPDNTVQTQSEGSTETRPKNVSVNYIIKY